ncbi:M14 family zinc carboxypeptidase [Pedobacter sp. ASV28]|uniref:M14 family zinc carboxypeptidase n=1 Tax=Pedobacter sp. ASV28 TaxID=2795123 RepID=UPI0018ED41CE|nr:M14 family zinc carboxypeptidase [Pedobacter sp. ASV28]
MNIQSTLSNYSSFEEKTLTNRFFKHEDIIPLIKQLPSTFSVSTLGHSVKGKSIHAVKWGNGKTKVMLWSQMHGDEATGTMALFDLFNFLQQDNEMVPLLAENCELYIIPMVNPDGAQIFTRRNAQQIDINRDFLQTLTPEAKILKRCREVVQPHFGFNLHDQLTLWSVDGTLKPATLSYLAPAIDKELSINPSREKAMLVIADMFKVVDPLLPLHIGLFDDEYEPRAFGDNFQKAGTSTILIEAGGYQNDTEKQEIRKFYFASILSGLVSIAQKSYLQQNTGNYFAIPKNNKQLFHILIHHLYLNGIHVSVGINYEECPDKLGTGTIKTYGIQDIGDLSFCDAYQVYDAKHYQLQGSILFNQPANFKLTANDQIILAFENGKLR